MGGQLDGRKEERTGNSTYPKGGVSCSKDSFVVNETLVFQIKFCGKIPALRVAGKTLCLTLKDDRAKNKMTTERKNNYICQITSRLNYVNNFWK
jgi:hypothetical protein